MDADVNIPHVAQERDSLPRLRGRGGEGADESNVRARLDAALVAGLVRACGEARWGVDDCALWCADILFEALGYDPAAPFRTGYGDRAGALKALEGRSLVEAIRAVAAFHGWVSIDAQDAQVGDIGIAFVAPPPVALSRDSLPRKRGRGGEGGDQRRPTTMICRARGLFVARGDHGFVAVPARTVAVAWDVIG